MRQKWLNLILHLTSLIHRKKEKILMPGLLKSVSLAIQIIFLEIILFIISLPTYLFITEGFSMMKDYNKKEVISYRLRRKFIISVIIVILTVFVLLQFVYAVLISILLSPDAAI